MALPGERAAATAGAAPLPPPVSGATGATREITSWAEFSGRLDAVERAELRSRVEGALLSVHLAQVRWDARVTC